MRKIFYLSLSLISICILSFQGFNKPIEQIKVSRVNYLAPPLIDNDKVVYSNHLTESYTKEEVIKKFIEAKVLNVYTKDNTFKKVPNYTGPNYYEGEITDEIVDDTLKQLNFYRWLSGLTPVTVKYDKLSRNQKGAFIDAVIGELTHTPWQPSDMSKEFYDEAYLGVFPGIDRNTNENFTANVNIGSYSTLPVSVGNYIDDINNVNSGVGHRSSMLDIYAQRTSFGTAYGYYKNWEVIYTAFSNYRKNCIINVCDNPGNNEFFYPYPTAGYFPLEATRAMDGDRTLSWSIRLANNLSINDNTNIELIYDGITYKVMRSDIEYSGEGYNTISWKLPSELVKKVTASNNYYIPNTKIDVIVNNLNDILNKDKSALIKYSTTFVTTNDKNIENIKLRIYVPNTYRYYVISEGKTFDFSYYNAFDGLHKIPLGFEYEPSDANVSTITFESFDKSVFTVNNDTKMLTVVNGGESVLKIKDDLTNKEFSYTLKFPIKNNNKGDLDSNNKIDLADVLIELKIFFGSVVPNDEQKIIGDMNDDGNITLVDVLMLLKLYFNN